MKAKAGKLLDRFRLWGVVAFVPPFCATENEGLALVSNRSY